MGWNQVAIGSPICDKSKRCDYREENVTDAANDGPSLFARAEFRSDAIRQIV